MKRPLMMLVGLGMLALLLVVCCERGGEVAGKYVTEEGKNGSPGNIRLHLMASGHGSWSRGEETASFRWEARGEEIWLHTKEGGLVVGKLVADRIEVSLPGVAVQVFKKIKE
jgi:hypothetical protein